MSGEQMDGASMAVMTAPVADVEWGNHVRNAENTTVTIGGETEGSTR